MPTVVQCKERRLNFVSLSRHVFRLVDGCANSRSYHVRVPANGANLFVQRNNQERLLCLLARLEQLHLDLRRPGRGGEHSLRFVPHVVQDLQYLVSGKVVVVAMAMAMAMVN